MAKKKPTGKKPIVKKKPAVKPAAVSRRPAKKRAIRKGDSPSPLDLKKTKAKMTRAVTRVLVPVTKPRKKVARKAVKKVVAKKVAKTPAPKKTAARRATRAVPLVSGRYATFTLRNAQPNGDARGGKWFADITSQGAAHTVGPYARAERARGMAIQQYPGAIELTPDGTPKAKGHYAHRATAATVTTPSPAPEPAVPSLPSIPIPLFKPPTVGDGLATDQDKLFETAHGILEKDRKRGMA